MFIVRKALVDDPGKSLQEVQRLVPSAEAHHRNGCGTLAAWARATRDFPEYKRGREAVNLLLVYLHSTGDAERMLRNIPWQERQDRAHMLDTTLESLLIAMQAPMGDDVGKQEGGNFKAIGNYLANIIKRYSYVFYHKSIFDFSWDPTLNEILVTSCFHVFSIILLI